MLISNSEVDTKLRCNRLHYYQYALGLYPKKVSRANSIGNLGHHVLEYYYRAIMEGESREDAFHAGMAQIIEAPNHEDYEIVRLVSQRFLQYHERYQNERFKVRGVEGVFSIPLENGTTYPLTLDLLVEYVDGPLAGQYVVIDHKFKYDFFSTDELSMHVQTYKYIYALRKLGYPVKRSMLNQIRYREGIKDIDKLFKREILEPTDIQLENIMREHMMVSSEIANVKQQPVSWYAQNAPRRFNPKDCGFCYFRIPCRQELLGKDASATLTDMYAPEDPSTFYRKYGY